MKYAGILLAVFLSAMPAAAGYYADLSGAYISVGKSKQQLGGGGALGITIIDNFSMLYRGIYTTASRSSLYSEKLQFNHMTHHVGFEYVLDIPVARLGWRNSFMLGYSYTRMDEADRETRFLEFYFLRYSVPNWVRVMNMLRLSHKRDGGLALALWTGIQVNALPFLAPFADIGIHKSFYFRELSFREIIGFHFMFGIRFMFGKSRDEN
ncbi:MAG: hypothetical protein JW807_04735 [Spirochaetes bacterium]|nr:hypothetical protein [Spirochaetota bacterium]